MMSEHAGSRKKLVCPAPPGAKCCVQYCTATAASKVCACCFRGPLTRMNCSPFGPTSDDAFTKRTGDKSKSPPQEIDWENENDRRIVAAALVNSVYLLQSENTSVAFWRRKIAKGWWEGHGFVKVSLLKEGDDNSAGPILGTIFRYNPTSDKIIAKNAASAPTFVIAFRGTANLWDALIDGHFIIGSVELTDRMVHAKDRVKKFMRTELYKSAPKGSRHRLWIAGHSLGAAVSISVGMSLLQDPVYRDEFDTFLFNPPFVSLSFITDIPKRLMCCSCWMFHRQLRKIENILGDILTKLFCSEKEDPDDILYRWLPNLFVNPMDPISMGFISYFEERKNEREKDKWVVASLRTSKGVDVDIGMDWSNKKLSLSYLMRSARMYVNREREKMEEARHPTLKLLRYWYCCGPLCIDYKTQECWINLFKNSHSLSQWYDRKVQVKPKVYINSRVAKKDSTGRSVCCGEAAANVSLAVPSSLSVHLDGATNIVSSP